MKLRSRSHAVASPRKLASAPSPLIAMLASDVQRQLVVHAEPCVVRAQSVAPQSQDSPMPATASSVEQIQWRAGPCGRRHACLDRQRSRSRPAARAGLRTRQTGPSTTSSPGQTTFARRPAALPAPDESGLAPRRVALRSDGAGPQAVRPGDVAFQKTGFVADSGTVLISNLIVDQTAVNPAAVAANFNPGGSGGLRAGGGSADPGHRLALHPEHHADFGLRRRQPGVRLLRPVFSITCSDL